MEVTEKARQHLTELLANVKPDPASETCFRIVKDGDAFRLEVGVPEASDETITAGGETVLAVDAEAVEKVKKPTPIATPTAIPNPPARVSPG